jgi:hypothetical protein
MHLPSAKRIWRTTLRALFNPNWKQQALRSRELRQAVTQFQHRAIYHDITPDILRNIRDNDLIRAIYDCVEARLPREHVGIVPPALGLPRACTSIYYYRMMDYDVGNGGFDQFLNGSGAEVAVLRRWSALRLGSQRQTATPVTRSCTRQQSHTSLVLFERIQMSSPPHKRPKHAPQRTRPSRHRCDPRVPACRAVALSESGWALPVRNDSLSLGH